MPVPPSFDASTSGPYIYQQEFAKRQQIYQRQASLSLNRNRISSNSQQGNFASSGKLRIYPKELSKSPQLQQQQQQPAQPQEAQKKGLIDTSPLLSAFNNAAGNFNNFVSSSPPVSATPPPFQLSSSPQLQPYGSPQLQPYGSPQLQPYVQQIPQGPSAVHSHLPHPNSLPNELPVGSASPPLHPIPYGHSPGHAVAAHSLPGGGGGAGGSSGGYRSPYNPLSYPPLSDNLYQLSPSAGHGQSLGFHIGPRHGAKPTVTKTGNACSFDVLDDLETLRSDFSPQGGGPGVITGTDVVCQGWEGGVDVWKVGRGVVELVARLEGLSGNVVGAKILPTLPRDDTNLSLRPLICLTLHSPVVSHNREAAALDNVQSPVLGPVSERPGSAQSHGSHRHDGSEQSKPSDVASEYQTTVEIYSLSQRMRIATLFKSAPIPVIPGAGAPPPWNIRVETSAIPGQGNVVVVGVGGSGELYVYGSSKVGGSFKKRMSNTLDESESGAASGWKCLTKLWANVQAESKQTVADAASLLSGEGVYTSNNGTPIFSLEGRWLAYAPIYVTSANRNNHSSRGGDVTVSCLQALSPNPPTQPQTNTFVDVPEEEPILNRVAREVTQEVIRGAKWVGEHGMRAVKNYWNGYNSGLSGTSPPQPAAANGVRIGPAPGSSGVSVLGMQVREMREREQDLASLGPGGAIGGHSTPGSSGGLATPPGFSYSSNDPAVVSIIDLGKPSGRQESFAPSSTFQPPLGVSFLSLAPGGLMLLTASTKGDVVLVWDLLKSAHQPGSAAASKGGQGSGKSATATSQVGSPDGLLGLPVTNGRLPNGQYAGRHVRQVARFTRMTVAHIVDVLWTNPRGDKLAVLTDKRTVHFFDMPANAFQWPPPRRAIPPPTNQGSVGGMVNSTKQAASNLLATTQPLVVAARRRRSSGSSASAAASSGKGENGFNAAGYNSGGSGAGGNSAGNRIALPPAAGTVSVAKGCVRFLGKEPGYVAMMAGGVLRIYESRKQGGGGRKKSSFLSGGVMTNDWLEYELPKPPDGVATGIVSSEPPSESSGQQAMSEIDPDDEEIAEMMVFPGFWAGKSPASHGPQSPRMKDHHTRQYNENPLSFAEIETSPPRQPVHNDRHITLSVFSGPPATHLVSNLSKNKTWVFGQPLQAEKLDVGSAKGEVEFKNGSDGLAVTEAMESALRLEQDEGSINSKVASTEERAVAPTPAAAAASRPKKKKGSKKATSVADMVATGGVPIDEGFFEDGCEVVIEDKKK